MSLLFKEHPELYTILIPAIAVPIMLGITFFVMGIEVIYNG